MSRDSLPDPLFLISFAFLTHVGKKDQRGCMTCFSSSIRETCLLLIVVRTVQFGSMSGWNVWPGSSLFLLPVLRWEWPTHHNPISDDEYHWLSGLLLPGRWDGLRISGENTRLLAGRGHWEQPGDPEGVAANMGEEGQIGEGLKIPVLWKLIWFDFSLIILFTRSQK